MSNVWKTVKKNYVYTSAYLRVRHDDVVRPDGTPGTYDVVERDNFVCVIPKISDTFYLVEQYRYPIGQSSIAFPQGMIEKNEKPIDAAKRELQEETGLIASEILELGNLALGEGHHTQRYTVFVADNCTTGKILLQESEKNMVIRIYSFRQLKELIKNGSIIDSPTVAAFGLYLLQ